MSLAIQHASKILPITFRQEFIDTLAAYRTPEAQDQDRLYEAKYLYSKKVNIAKACASLPNNLDEIAKKYHPSLTRPTRRTAKK